MKFWRFLSILFAFVLLSSALSCFAFAEGIVEPQLNYTKNIDAFITISGGKATVTGTISPLASTETRKVSIIVYLQRKENGKWRSLDSWSGSATNATAKASGSKTIERGYEYRALAVGRISTAEGVLLERPTSASSSQSY